MKKLRGFTLIEVMMVVAILAILVKVATPSFREQIIKSAVSSAVTSFIADTRFARSEGVRRGGSVIMCRSDAPEATTPVCNTNSGPGGNGWVSGWLVFEDRDSNANFSAGDQLLRVQGPITNLDRIVESGGASTKLVFTAMGRMNLASATSFTFGSTSTMTSAQQRAVCVGQSGRARIVGDGTTSCSSATDQ